MKFEGFITINDYGLIEIGELDEARDLVQEVYNKFKVGDVVNIKYFLSDTEMTLEQAIESSILKTIGAEPIDKLYYILDAYSEYTVMELAEDFVVGGHDFEQIFHQADGKYLILIIEKIS